MAPEVDSHIPAPNLFNHRQADLLRHALKHPFQEYTIASHGRSHNVVYQTARTDLIFLAKRGVLRPRTRGRKLVFTPSADLAGRLRQMETKSRRTAGSPRELPAGPSDRAS